MLENIRIIGSHPEKAQIVSLLRRCDEELQQLQDRQILILLDGEEILPGGDFCGAACPMGARPENIKNTLCYSAENIGADIVALNVQEKSEYTCFELMAGNQMGRVFVSNKKGVGVQAVLITAAALMLCEIGLNEIIAVLNGILKTD